MKIKLVDIKEDARRFSGELPTDVIELGGEDQPRVLGPVRYDVSICIVSEILIARGQLAAPIAFCCGRCGEYYNTVIEESDYYFTLDLAPGDRSSDGARADAVDKSGFSEESGQNTSCRVVEKGIDFVDLTADMRESIILRFPGYPICGQACQGRCPKCGQNLNIERCSCKIEPVDNRWGALDHLDV